MNLLNIFKNKTHQTNTVQTAVTTTAKVLYNDLSSQSNTFSLNDAGLISSLYTCIKLKADILSTLPLKVYKKNEKGNKVEYKEDYRYTLLHDEPNNYQNCQQIRSAMFWDMFWHGNGFALLNRDNIGRVESYEYISAEKVKACAPWNNQLWYLVDREEMLDDGSIKKYHQIINSRFIYHFRNSTNDGLWGQSPLDALFLNLSTSYKGTKTIDNFYKNNLFLQKALKTTNIDVRLEDEIKKQQDQLEKDYMGFNPNKKLFVLPWNTELLDITGSIQDAQILDTVKFNANQIAVAQGVPTILVGDSAGAKFSNVELLLNFFEATSLRTESDIVRRETEYKFFTKKERDSGLSAEFNFSQFAQSDNAGRAANYRTYFSMGVLSPNDIAGKEGYPTYEGGDIHIINGGGQTVEAMSNQTSSTPNPTSNEIDGLKGEIEDLKTSFEDLKKSMNI
jgi:HK97 family phage portal protein